MELKQLMLDIRKALATCDYALASNLVESSLQSIMHEETTAQEKMGKVQWENPILKLDRVDAILARPNVESIAVQVQCVHQYRFNGMYVDFRFLTMDADGQTLEDVTEDLFDQDEQNEFSEWFSDHLGAWHENESAITDSWALVALFGVEPDPGLINKVLSQRINLNLSMFDVSGIFGDWHNFVAHRYERLQSREMVEDEDSSDS
jgi:hypothetical protein